MTPRHLHPADDFIWFLDHPRRRYRLVAGHDAPLTDEGYPTAVLIIRKDGGPNAVVPFHAEIFEHSDDYADDLLVESLEDAVRLFGQAGR